MRCLRALFWGEKKSSPTNKIKHNPSYAFNFTTGLNIYGSWHPPSTLVPSIWFSLLSTRWEITCYFLLYSILALNKYSVIIKQSFVLLQQKKNNVIWHPFLLVNSMEPMNAHMIPVISYALQYFGFRHMFQYASRYFVHPRWKPHSSNCLGKVNILKDRKNLRAF